ncbi:MAG TPA: acyl-CoA dehydrogenase family protein [Acetobacteraceae bacterium]|nr:acyl-CoA dehydrogenase family protein [Acetobacteraceae bacterium]
MDSAPSAEEHDLLEQARAMVPVLAERAAATVAARDVPRETIADFHRAGILRITQPRRFGGLQLRYSVFSRIVELLTEGCASSAWVYAVLGEHQWLLASFPLQSQIDVWGDEPQALASSSLAPRTVANRVAGGWRLNGQYPFSSGSTHARWAIIGAFLDPERDPDSVGYLLVPFTDIEIIDDWHVLGLAGTGSRSLLLRDVFVPEHRCALLSEMHAGTPPGAAVHPDYPMVRAPRGLFVNYSLPPVAIALGNRALSTALAILRERVSRGMARKADSEFVQITVAEAAAAIDAATLTMHRGRAAAEAMIMRGEPIAEEYVLRTRRDMTHAQHQVQWAVEQLVEVCGARSVYDADPLASIRRDILTVLTHVIASRQLAMRAWGKWALN